MSLLSRKKKKKKKLSSLSGTPVDRPLKLTFTDLLNEAQILFFFILFKNKSILTYVDLTKRALL